VRQGEELPGFPAIPEFENPLLSMVKKVGHRLERLAAEQPVLLAFLVFVAATLIVVPSSIPFWLEDPRDFLKEIMAEAYGTLFDLLIIGWFLMWLSKRAERFMLHRRYREEIEDFLGWQSHEATHRIGGNIRRLNRGGVREGFRLTEAYLSGANLTGALLKSSDMWGCNLSGALLGGANLHASNIGGANLENAILEHADLHEADLRGANLKDADLERANLEGADLRGVNLIGADLQYASLRDANLERCTLIGTNLRGVDLSGANLSRCLLEGANLEGANLLGTNLEGAELTRAYLTGATLARNGELGDHFATAKSLFKARLDPGPERQLRKAHPHLFEEPEAERMRRQRREAGEAATESEMETIDDDASGDGL
jgi:BTB/POZ domain-containing protein KCTD9